MANKSDIAVSTSTPEVMITRTINAPRELVFDAFTKAEHLAKWFGPQGFQTKAKTDPRVGGKYKITMHATSKDLPENLIGGDYPMTGEYTEFVRPERLAYTADLSEHPQSWKDAIVAKMPNAKNEDYLNSATAITFEDVAGKTKLTVRVTFSSDAVRDGYVKTGMNEGWELSFQKLEAYLGDDVIVERTLDAPVALVWRAISDPKAMKAWYFDAPEFRAVVGTKFEMWGGPPEKQYLHKCEVTEVVPERRLAYTWRFEGLPGDSVVAFDLTPEGEKTKIKLTHSGVESFAVSEDPNVMKAEFAKGWTHLMASGLPEFLEKQS